MFRQEDPDSGRTVSAVGFDRAVGEISVKGLLPGGKGNGTGECSGFSPIGERAGKLGVVAGADIYADSIAFGPEGVVVVVVLVPFESGTG